LLNLTTVTGDSVIHMSSRCVTHNRVIDSSIFNLQKCLLLKGLFFCMPAQLAQMLHKVWRYLISLNIFGNCFYIFL